MGRQQSNPLEVSRPKRRATNTHIFRYLQTRNPTRLEENDLKKALEASLEECPDFWPAEDSASCSSSEQSNATSSGSSTSSSVLNHLLQPSSSRSSGGNKSSRRNKSMQPNHLRHSNPLTANSNCCPSSGVHNNRYKPVARKNIYNEADFFHDGIMQYIEYELSLARSREICTTPTKRAARQPANSINGELNSSE